MRLDNLGGASSSEFKRIEKSNRKESSDVAPKRDSLKKDSVKISERESSQILTEYKILFSRISVEPELREGRLSEVVDRQESGYYNSERFAEDLADKLIGSTDQ